MTNPSPTWMPFAALAISIVSAVIALLGYFNARHSLKLNQQAAGRRQPRLSVSLQNGYVKRSGGPSEYAVLLAVSNPTDIDNSVSRIDLRVDYRPPSGFCARVDVPASIETRTSPDAIEGMLLSPPVKIGAHQTIIGWVRFSVEKNLFHDCKVDAYAILLVDSHADSTIVEVSIFREIVDGK
jgi:hypothetical protein